MNYIFKSGAESQLIGVNFRYLYILLIATLWIFFVRELVAQEDAQSPDLAIKQHSNIKVPTRTGKERLGKKWTDEQRVNNCDVPIEFRGDTPRSDDCAVNSKEQIDQPEDAEIN